MPIYAHSAKIAAAAAALLWSASAQAATDPTGIWFDHNGRGAVEIKPCASGKGVCGYVVNVKDPANASRCGLQILGEVTPGGGGWIYSPERKSKYDVELTRLSDDKLRVVGNAGSRFFSRTFTWNRAPDDIARCGETTAAAAPAKDATAEAKPAVTSTAPPQRPGSRRVRRAARRRLSPIRRHETTGAVAPADRRCHGCSHSTSTRRAPAKPAAATSQDRCRAEPRPLVRPRPRATPARSASASTRSPTSAGRSRCPAATEVRTSDEEIEGRPHWPPLF